MDYTVTSSHSARGAIAATRTRDEHTTDPHSTDWGYPNSLGQQDQHSNLFTGAGLTPQELKQFILDTVAETVTAMRREQETRDCSTAPVLATTNTSSSQHTIPPIHLSSAQATWQSGHINAASQHRQLPLCPPGHSSQQAPSRTPLSAAPSAAHSFFGIPAAPQALQSVLDTYSRQARLGAPRDLMCIPQPIGDTHHSINNNFDGSAMAH